MLFGLGIPHVGSVTAQALADGFGTMAALREASPETIAEVEGVGPVIAEQVAGWFLDPEHAEIVDALAAAGLRMEGPRRAQAPAGPLAGKTFVVTGALEGFSRDGIAEHLAGLGAKVTNTVSSNTDYLLAGAGGGSKRAKGRAARRAGDLRGRPGTDRGRSARRLLKRGQPGDEPASSCTIRSCSTWAAVTLMWRWFIRIENARWWPFRAVT